VSAILRSGMRIRTVSPVLARARAAASTPTDRSIRRRLGWVWGLLFFNVLTYSRGASNLVPLPSIVGKALTEAALPVALGLILTVNRRLLVRQNILLFLFTVLCATSAVMSFRGYYGLGSMVRCTRFVGFVSVLWLTSLWWGRRDFMLCRFHCRALLVVLVTVMVGMAIAPGKAFSNAGGGRLGGTLWPIPPTQVAHYAAVLTGLTVVMWFADMDRSRWTGGIVVIGISVLILTHTRTALLALLAGILAAGLSLFLTRKRVRRAFAMAVVVTSVGAISFAPFLSSWFARGESTQQLSGLTGRTSVWTALVTAPRTEVNAILGYGMSNDSYGGLPIDSSWLSTYLDQGLVGDVIDAMTLLALLIIALLSPRGPGKAIALFLVVYCAIASYTETGLGQPSPYLLDLAVAMSVLMPSLSHPRTEHDVALRAVI
jgi:hypothetical protein